MEVTSILHNRQIIQLRLALGGTIALQVPRPFRGAIRKNPAQMVAAEGL